MSLRMRVSRIGFTALEERLDQERQQDDHGSDSDGVQQDAERLALGAQRVDHKM